LTGATGATGAAGATGPQGPPGPVPEAPTDGQQYARQSAAWSVVTSGGGGAATYIGDTPPASPTVGQLWWKSDSGNLFIWYNDGTSSQWVAATIGSPGPPGPALTLIYASGLV
jgi:hypothetical protein